jgi:Na+/glutamate symporter
MMQNVILVSLPLAADLSESFGFAAGAPPALSGGVTLSSSWAATFEALAKKTASTTQEAILRIVSS